MMLKRVLLTICLFMYYVNGDCEVEAETLCVNQVNEDGFGDENNQYAWSMATFKDSVYVGTLNAEGGIGQMALFFLGQPFVTKGAQVWKGDIDDEGEWKWVQVLNDGFSDVNNYGIRSFEVIGEYLYGVTANHVSGFELWRTKDGEEWEVVFDDGSPNGQDFENTSGRGLGYFVTDEGERFLYVGCENRRTGAKMWRRAVKESGDWVKESKWQQIVSDGLGNAANFWFSDFAQFNDYLYTGTLNMAGMQLWRTKNGVDFEMIFDQGNGNVFESAVMRLLVYNDKLYFGTMNFQSGAGLYVNTDDDGKVFESLFVDGNGNRMNAYVWQLKEFENRLYIGTFKMFGEFDLYSTGRLNKVFLEETLTGFGNEGQYGIRSFTIFQNKLMIGSATAGDENACQIYQSELLSTSSSSSSSSLSFISSAPKAIYNDDGTIKIQIAFVIFCSSLFFLCIGIWIGKRGNNLPKLQKQIDL